MLKTNIPGRHLALGIIVLFLVTSYFVISDFGITVDSPKNFREGRLNLHFLLTGKILDENVALHQTHGALMFMAGEASALILHRHLGWIQDPTTARHAVLPIFMAWFFWVFFKFIKTYWSSRTGLCALLFFMTYPGFVGQAFNNLKDTGLLVFFSLTIMAFFDWFQKRQLRFFYAFFIFLGLALSIKLAAFITLLVLTTWRLSTGTKRIAFPYPPRTLHLLYGITLTAMLLAFFYFPAFWGIQNKSLFIQSWLTEIKNLSYLQKTSWGWAPFRCILYQTPVFMLFAATIGALESLLKSFRNPKQTMLLFWLLLPLILGCLPSVNYYAGMRHFLFFLPPFVIFTSLGVDVLARCFAPILRFTNPKTLSVQIAAIIFVCNFSALRTMHPYESLFASKPFGGLKTIQKNRVNTISWDKSFSFFKEAAVWLNQNAHPNANVIAIYYTGMTIKEPWRKVPLIYYLTRKDLRVIRKSPVQWQETIPSNTYIIYMPAVDYIEYDRYREFLNTDPDLRPVYRSERQGGEIFTIYYKL